MEPTPESLFERHLASQSEGDFEDALAAEVEAFAALLEEHPQHAKGLTQLRDAQRGESQGSSGPLVGDLRAAEGVTIGDFQLVKKLGRGGMGEVWEAEQVSLSRRVALKLLPAAGSERAQEFFAREARAGGRLNHPGIVSVMGTGEDEGVRWISMELVEGGRTLRDFLDEARAKEELPDQYYPEIAELFAKIAEAMAVAHEAGVIHRDLKPANIMVTGEGEPKVADFGLARVLDEQGLSQSGEVMGTFYYMSPEQVKAARGGVDHRADVFSLGALFYEALVMARPFEGDTTLQIVEKILNHDPPDPKALRSRVPEDLAVICTKALEKDREGRYDSMTELAADLRHHLADEPIQAQPPSTWKRTVKWARRNPTKSVAGAVAAAAFVAISGLAWQLQEKTDEAVANAERAEANAEEAAENEERAKRSARQAEVLLDLATANAEEAEAQRGKAERRAADLQQVSDFQAKQLSGVDPEAMGGTIRAMVLSHVRAAGEKAGRDPETLEGEQEALERLLAGADFTGLGLGVLDKHVFVRVLRELEDLEDQPEVQAQLLQTVAITLRELGLRERALEPQKQALGIRRRTLGDEHLRTLASINSLGSTLLIQGKYDEAEPLLREALEAQRRTLGDEHPETLASFNNLGHLLQKQGKYDEAEALSREGLKTRRRTLGDEHPSTLVSIGNLGQLFKSQGRLNEAESLFREALEGFRRTQGDEHSNTLTSIGILASLLHDQSKYDEAEALSREGLETRRRTQGNEHPGTLSAIINLGSLLRTQGKLDEAEPLLREGLKTCRRTLGNEHPGTLSAITSLGYLLRTQGKLDEAEPLVREALETQHRTLGDEHPKTLGAINNLGCLLRDQSKYDEGEALLRGVVKTQRRTLGDEHFNATISISNLGSILLLQHKLDEAEPLLREALETQRRILGDESGQTQITKQRLEALLNERKGSEASSPEPPDKDGDG